MSCGNAGVLSTVKTSRVLQATSGYERRENYENWDAWGILGLRRPRSVAGLRPSRLPLVLVLPAHYDDERRVVATQHQLVHVSEVLCLEWAVWMRPRLPMNQPLTGECRILHPQYAPSSV